MADLNNKVTAAKPKVGGAIWRAPIGTPLPTDATTKLNDAFKSLGFISEDGLQNDDKRSSENIKEWGGGTVLSLQKEKTDNFKFTLIEALDVEVLKTVYGDDNVTGTLETGITIKSNAKELDESVYVIEVILKGGYIKRIVIPSAKISETGTVNYKNTEVLGYEITLEALLDANGDSHIEYIAKGTASVPEEV